MATAEPLKWRHFFPEIIVQAVRWYCRSALSYRDIEELMIERGIEVGHTTVYRWVQQYGPDLERGCHPHRRPTHDAWRVDETYIRVKGDWKYLYRAVDSDGNPLDCFLTAKRFFRNVLKATHTQAPRVINGDKDPHLSPRHGTSAARQDLTQTDKPETGQIFEQSD